MPEKQPKSNLADNLKWGIVVLLLGSGIYSYYHFATYSILIRVMGMLAVVVVAAIFAYQTNQGKKFWAFASEARQEIRRVVWPTRQETVQAGLLVVVMVIVMGIILWAIDSILLRLVAWITSPGGS